MLRPGDLEQRRHAGQPPRRAHLLGLGEPAGRGVAGEHRGARRPPLRDPLGPLHAAERLARDPVLVAEAGVAVAEDDDDVVAARHVAQRTAPPAACRRSP